MFQVRTRAPRRAMGVLAVASMLMALAVAPASAADADLADALNRIEQFQARQADSGEARAYAQDGSCIDDDAGDVIDFEQGTASDTGSEDAADLVQVCANFGPTLSLTAQVVEPTDPATDDAWLGATSILWAIDAGDDGDYFAVYSLDGDRNLSAIVIDGSNQSVTCTVQAAFTGLHTVNGIAPSCIGGATDVAVAAAVFYDTSTEDEDGPVIYDQAPDSGEPADVPAGGEERDTDRLSGATRYETSVAISQKEFDQGADVVYVARAFDVLVDAVAGGVLTDGPILLVPQCGDVPAAILTEIDRVDPDEVIALGGAGAVCDATLAQAAGDRDADRLAGTSRFETAVAISNRAFPEGADELYIARADIVADAIAGGVLTDGPILLVPSTGDLPSAVADEIERVDPDVVVALGGSGAIDDDVLTASGEAGAAETARISGSGRIETALAISRYQFPGTAPELYLARADVFADALAGGVLTGGPIVLVPSCAEFDTVTGAAAAQLDNIRAEISRVAPDTVFALGGEAAVCDAWLEQAAQA
jgi:putative cell wall-binding protein